MKPKNPMVLPQPHRYRKRQQQQQQQQRHRVALVSDFVYPRLGGVENHIWSLAQELLKLGHKVVVITHAYEGYKGVHYFRFPRRENRQHDNGKDKDDKNDSIECENDLQLKVYYCPFRPMTDEDALPTFTATFPLVRWILIREQIEIVHGHQATSTLANESIVYAGMLGLCAVYTDHSLFSLHDLAGVILNRVLSTTLATVDAAICVSRACRDNFILRTRLDARRVFVIPNAVDATKFRPSRRHLTIHTDHDSSSSSNNNNNTARLAETDTINTTERIVVVVVSRLAYRKGVDLLVGIVPQICRHFPQVDFLIAGDGPKRLALQEMVEAERLQERVHLQGAVPHEQVRDVLVQGHIFLNCSLTESFCIAILEASCAGLTVVSTNVGGIPEVLDEGVQLADPNVSDMVQALQHAIYDHMENGPENPWPRHERLAKRYAWHKVAQETVRIYDRVRDEPRKTFLERLECYLLVGGGGMTGLIAAWLAVSFELFSRLVDWQQPIYNIDVLPDTTRKYTKR